MASNEIAIILNPVAGKGRAFSFLSALEKSLIRRGRDYVLELTEAPGHAIELAEKWARRGKCSVVAAGGDGTCNEVINGLMRSECRESVSFGILPLGRGNDFAYGCSLPSGLEECLDIVCAGQIRPLDIGQVTGGLFPGGRYFGNGVGIGFDTVVGLEAAKMKKVHDALGYVLGTLKTLILFPESPTVEIAFGGETVLSEAVQISLMNGSRMGGFFYMAPRARINDGKLDLCVVSRSGRLRLIKTIIRYTKGDQDQLPWVKFHHCESVRLKAFKTGLTAHADGETVCIGGSELAVSLHPSALNLLGPPGQRS